MDATLSNFSSTNGVYLNGNAAGWVNVAADGTLATQIRMYGSTNASANIMYFQTNSTERMRVTSAGNVLINTTTEYAGLTNFRTTGVLSANSPNGKQWSISNVTAASNNATVDVLRFLTADGTQIGNYGIVGEVQLLITQPSTGNSGNYIYSIMGTGNGLSSTSFTVIASQTRGTSPVASVAIAAETSGSLKVQVTYINNAGITGSTVCYASFIGVIY